ncbi:MAG: transcriptional repressor [Anaerolineae bacterium]|nr:transcriptional repressor [Anaerolineae bacterium]
MAADPTLLEDILADLRAHGHRITTPRRLVLDELLAHRDVHLSCEDVIEALTTRGLELDPVTVYRTLQWLKDAGLVAQTDLGMGYAVYSWVEDPPHHHLVCQGCGRIINVDDALFESLRETLRTRYGFQARIEHFAIFGLCQDCAGHTGHEGHEG